MRETEALLDLDHEWREAAACAGRADNRFFPVNEAETSLLRAAKAICSGCPVRLECLDYAIETGQTEGIWGGLTSRERRVTRRERMAAARRAS